VIRVLIYDDSEAIRLSVGELINNADGLISVGSFSNVMQVTAQIEALKPDIVLMDINMPGRNGIEATQLIKSINPGIKVLIQTAFDNEQWGTGAV
jgi:DNA-binding NarL/FixJ family response regulator